MLHSLEQLRDGSLAGSRRIKLACGLQDFPVDLFALAETLEILDLSGNQLCSLPDDLPRLKRLRIIFCSDNQFETLPAVLGQCPQLEMVGFKANRIRYVPSKALPPKLRWLILTDNHIESLPEQIGQCQSLQKLMLAGNQLRQLPAGLARCRQLELLRIAANQLDTLPDWLFALPRLSWLAYAGNPCSPSISMAAETPEIDWGTLQFTRQLGEGASGIIHQATWQTDPVQDVAVKLFKGEVTSDGFPLSEMAACIQAGPHPNLIPVLGRIAGHPENTQGLMLSLIDPDYCNLAGPPSLESCTRDVYPETCRFNLSQLLRIASGIASATAHLHSRGILHGDLYGHNILHNPSGTALLGDFGAASFFHEAAPCYAKDLQRLEARAFACLLEELQERCTEQSDPVTASLHELQQACAHEQAECRPLFQEIARTLTRLEAQYQSTRQAYHGPH